ncbi:hypothetical protein WISP_00603 [Willisornis vidua]|uniref:Uncharacterized protein n=1 Tax=Willisornis vidua TaxID=1566151 RepID=A0ABQ9DWG9_9PASS|nr:hypothetical protein WISP_00603 [Willisornis vidua]
MAPAGSANLPWVEKYRPQALSELVSHRDILSTGNTPRLERLSRYPGIPVSRYPHIPVFRYPGILLS